MAKGKSKIDATEEIDVDAYYSDDEDVQHGRPEYKTVITYEDTAGNTSGLGQFIGSDDPYCRIFLMFDVNRGWKSTLRLRVIMKEKNADDQIIVIRLGSTAILDRNVTVEFVQPELLPPSIGDIAKMQQANEEGLIYRVNVVFKPEGVVSDRLWANLTGHATLSTILEKLREIFKATTLELYVRTATGITEDVNEFLEIVEEERVNNPLNTWHPAHPTKHFVQLGQIATPECRPPIKLASQTSFLTTSEYITIMGYGAIAEHEVAADQAENIQASLFTLQAITVPGGGEHRYLALIDSLEDIPVRFDQDEVLKVNFNVDIDDCAEDWSAAVVEHLPFGQTGQTSIVLRRPWDRENGAYKGEPLAAISHHFKTDEDIRAKCRNGAKMRVKIQVILQDKALKHQINALRVFQEERGKFHKVIRGPKYTKAWSKDIFTTIPPDAIDRQIDALNLTSSQTDALTYCRALPYGIGIIQGPPGTGKSHWCAEMIRPFLHNDNDAHQVLVVTPMNSTVDELIKKIDAAALKETETKDRIIIRLHSLTTEEDIIWNTAKGDRDPRPKVIDEEELSILGEFDVARTIYEIYKGTDRSESIVMDKRVRLIEHSLANWMLRVAGVMPHAVSDPNNWKGFREQYSSYRDDDLDSTQRTQFKKSLTSLREHVLHIASVVVSTINNAGTPKLFTNFKPAVVFMDEAAKMIEPDATIAFAHYAPAPIVMIGDHKQLKPTVLSKAGPSPQFAGQMTMSFFTRLIRLGHPSKMFIEQHRMNPDISRISSRIFYNGQLTDATTTHLDAHPLGQKMMIFMREEHDSTNLALMLDVKGRTELIGNSSCNLVNASVSINIMEKLLERFEPKDLAIISPYRAQHKVYHRAIHRLQSKFKNKDLRAIQNKTIDSFQGNEATIIILDLVVTKKLGFTREMNRLNVALTRARDGMIIITDIAANETQCDHGFVCWVNKLISLFKQSRLVRSVKDVTKNPYVPESVEISKEKVQEEGSVAAGDETATQAASEEISPPNPFPKEDEDNDVQADTSILDDGVSVQADTSILDGGVNVQPGLSVADGGINAQPSTPVNIWGLPPAVTSTPTWVPGVVPKAPNTNWGAKDRPDAPSANDDKDGIPWGGVTGE